MADADRASLGFLTWSSAVPTGGNVYDDRLTQALQDAGVEVRRHRVRGTWPAQSEQHRVEVARVLSMQPVWLVDSIIACAVPDLVRAAAHRGEPVTIVLHSLLSTELGLTAAEQARYRRLEADALHAAGRVITTSRWAADDLRRRYGLTHAVVARPGTDPAPVVGGSRTGGRLLCLGSLTPTKSQLDLVTALTAITDLSWSLRLVGGDRVHPDYTSRLHRAVRRRRLGGRIMITGPLTGSDLEAVWADTDLLVITSRSETYGMVVAEALAHGIPAVVSAGTGAVEALGDVDGEVPGDAVPAGEPATLAGTLRRWLTDPMLRDRWRATARRRRIALPSWQQCAATVLETLNSSSQQG